MNKNKKITNLSWCDACKQFKKYPEAFLISENNGKKVCISICRNCTLKHIQKLKKLKYHEMNDELKKSINSTIKTLKEMEKRFGKK
ncbi:MAG: hypothetical protein QXI16_04280 [Sulfolobaceae archaeon]